MVELVAQDNPLGPGTKPESVETGMIRRVDHLDKVVEPGWIVLVGMEGSFAFGLEVDRSDKRLGVDMIVLEGLWVGEVEFAVKYQFSDICALVVVEKEGGGVWADVPEGRKDRRYLIRA